VPILADSRNSAFDIASRRLSASCSMAFSDRYLRPPTIREWSKLFSGSVLRLKDRSAVLESVCRVCARQETREPRSATCGALTGAVASRC